MDEVEEVQAIYIGRALRVLGAARRALVTIATEMQRIPEGRLYADQVLMTCDSIAGRLDRLQHESETFHAEPDPFPDETPIELDDRDQT